MVEDDERLCAYIYLHPSNQNPNDRHSSIYLSIYLYKWNIISIIEYMLNSIIRNIFSAKLEESGIHNYLKQCSEKINNIYFYKEKLMKSFFLAESSIVVYSQGETRRTVQCLRNLAYANI